MITVSASNEQADVREPSDAEVAETFLTAFGRQTTYDLRRSQAGPWLYGIATTLVARHRRSERRLYRGLDLERRRRGAQGAEFPLRQTPSWPTGRGWSSSPDPGARPPAAPASC
jgi:DNA-directed RNA polymerase specialized sigma24 family protein